MARSPLLPPRTRSRLIPRGFPSAMATAISACFAATVSALPLAPTVVNGSATFAQSGNVLNVTNSSGAIINWNSFSIGAGETTRFIQASASSSVLNRVLANDPSVILGTLTSNGKVWLINPSGILVGAGAAINTAGFIASTLNITDANFLANKLKFDATAVGNVGAGSIVNQGNIITPSGGTVYLVAPNVSNAGLITTPQGETILAAGQSVTLLDTGTPGVSVEIVGPQGSATNLGTIVADAGRIGIAGVIVRNAGTLNASSVVNEGGHIFLKASQDAYVDGNGRIVTTGTKGGKVEVLGNRVAVMDNASIDASGTNGGGTVLIGGDYQGKNPNVQNSSITYFGPDATLKADATDNGNGGKVIIWANDTTRAYGHISAKGGPNGGNGGFVETSGHRYLDVEGIKVNTGNGGEWLLDPSDVNIANGSDSFTASFSGGVFYGGIGISTLSWGTISSNLSTSNVYITTLGDGGLGNITISSGTFSNSSGNSLNLFAHDNINASGVNMTLSGGLSMHAGRAGVIVDGADLIAGADATHSNITLTNGSFQAGRITLVAGNVVLNNTTLDTNFVGDVVIGAYADFFGGSGTIMQNGGTVRGSRVGLISDRDINVSGILAGGPCGDCGEGVFITAGVFAPGIYGGDIHLNAGSNVTGASFGLVAKFGSVNNSGGQVIQASGGYLEGADSIGTSQITAERNVQLLGNVVLNNANRLNVTAGYGGVVGQGIIIATLNNVTRPSASVALNATGNIDVAATGDIHTNTFNATTSGGNMSFATATGKLFIDGGSFSLSSAKLLMLNSLTGDVEVHNRLNSSGSLFVHAGHDVLMNFSPVILSANNNNVTVSAGNDISMVGSDIGTSNGNAVVRARNISMDRGSGIYGYNAVAVNANVLSMDHNSSIGGYYAASVSVGGSISMDHGSGIFGDYGVSVVSSGPITLRNDSGIAGRRNGVASIISGGQLSLDNSFIFGNGVSIGATGVSLDHNSVVFSNGNGNGAPANVKMVISGGDLTLDNGSHIGASHDVILTMTGASAQVVLNRVAGESPSTILAGSHAITHINFLNRSSGGIIIDGAPTTTTVYGGSGFFARNLNTPSSPGNGLEITYANGSTDNRASQTIDQFFNNLTDSTPLDDKKKKDGHDTEGNNQDEDHDNHTGQCS